MRTVIMPVGPSGLISAVRIALQCSQVTSSSVFGQVRVRMEQALQKISKC
jgi:hypothetical protein